MTESLVEWLSAQLDVDQRRAEAWEHDNPDDGGYYACPAVQTEPYGDLPWGEENCDCGLAARRGFTLADIATKRRILAEVVPSIDQMDTKIAEEWGGYCKGLGDQLLRLLALPYAGRDGWREEWRPE